MKARTDEPQISAVFKYRSRRQRHYLYRYVLVGGQLNNSRGSTSGRDGDIYIGAAAAAAHFNIDF